MPIIIYKYILFTTFKEQLTFTTQLYNSNNAATFKADGLKNGLCCNYYLSALKGFVNNSTTDLAIGESFLISLEYPVGCGPKIQAAA